MTVGISGTQFVSDTSLVIANLCLRFISNNFLRCSSRFWAAAIATAVFFTVCVTPDDAVVAADRLVNFVPCEAAFGFSCAGF